MSRGLNEVRIIGNLGRMPEMRYTPNGKAVTTFSVAVNERWGDGEEQKRTEWFNCEAWGRTAEILNEYLKKGSPIYLSGRQQTDKWEKDGSTHYKLKLVVKEFLFLGDTSGESTAVEADAQTSADENYEFGTE